MSIAIAVSMACVAWVGLGVAVRLGGLASGELLMKSTLLLVILFLLGNGIIISLLLGGNVLLVLLLLGLDDGLVLGLTELGSLLKRVAVFSVAVASVAVASMAV